MQIFGNEIATTTFCFLDISFSVVLQTMIMIMKYILVFLSNFPELSS